MAETDKNLKIDKKILNSLLETALHLPRAWCFLTGIIIVISTFNITWNNTTKGMAITFQITPTTALFFALLWLPALLRIFTLLGGGLKTPAGELSSPGISEFLKALNSDTLGIIIEDADTAKQGASTAQAAEYTFIKQEAQEIYTSRFSPRDARKELGTLAKKYNHIREQMPSGDERTLQLRSISGRMRALAPFANFQSEEVKNLLLSRNGGQRILGLSIVRSTVQPLFFDELLPMIEDPKSAYEQNQALQFMRDKVPPLNNAQKRRLIEVLNKQLQHDATKHQWIHPDSYRGFLSYQILSSVQDTTLIDNE